MKKYLLINIFLFLIFSSFAQTQKNWNWGGELDPLQAKFKILHYELNLHLNPDLQKTLGSNKITYHSVEKLDTIRLNLIEEYQVSKIIMDDQEVKFNHHGDILDIYPWDCTCNEVTIYYSGQTPIAIRPPWTGGFTWEKDENNMHWMGLSSQNEGAKIFMPALDHPSSKALNGVDLFLTAPKPYFVAANGVLKNTSVSDSSITYHWATEYPINNYNINFTLGDFHEAKTTFISADGSKIPMHVFVLKENKDKAQALLSVLETSAKTHEKFFGPYPFPKDKIAVVETPYLGMEHQTINAYGNNFQFVPMGNVQYDWLLHHELGHEWFGNKITVKDWADYWIHEGLTAYGDWLFYLEHGGDEAYHEKVESVRRSITHARPVVSPRNTSSDVAYHPEIYTKGAFIIHSLRFYLGDDVFFPMLQALTSNEDFTYQEMMTTENFIQFVNDYTGQDLTGFLDLYLTSVRKPKVSVKKKGKNRYSVSLTQVNFELPIEIETDAGIQRHLLKDSPLIINSTKTPVIDPRNWYLLDR
jgi:aminopeptidase N